MPIGGNYFPSVRKAREALREQAFELYEMYKGIIKQAAAAGDYETAAKHTQYLIEHIPEEDGQRMLAISIDKPTQTESGPRGPTINIGVKIGGSIPQQQLAEGVIIDAE